MLSFKIDQEKCDRCGRCAADCPARIIAVADGWPAVLPEKEIACYRCQHCFAVCPTGALSIFGLSPADTPEIAGSFPEPERLEALIKGRRSVRRYAREDLDPSLIRRLLEVAWHAPTGVNSRQVRFTVVDNRATLERVRDEILTGIGRLVQENALPEKYARFAGIHTAWEEKRQDIIFRDAPHLVIASAPQEVATPIADCLIALSYFELYAQANGVGTVWGGLAKYAIDDLVPESRVTLGIPENHVIGYVVIFGNPDVHYARAVRHAPALIHRV